MAEVNLMDRLKVNRAVPNIDVKYGPYASKEEAFSILGVENMDVLSEGLTIGIIEDDRLVEYWFQGGIELENLVRKNDAIVVDLKDYNEGGTLIANGTYCTFVYNNEFIYKVPCIYSGENGIIVYCNLLQNSTIINKAYVIIGATIVKVYDTNIPDWINDIVPATISKKVAELDKRLTWK